MRVWPTVLAACCAVSFDAAVALAQQSRTPPQFVLNATTALSQDVCYWAGAPYSAGARILAPHEDRDPHVIIQSFICRGGTWAQD